MRKPEHLGTLFPIINPNEFHKNLHGPNSTRTDLPKYRENLTVYISRRLSLYVFIPVTFKNAEPLRKTEQETTTEVPCDKHS